MNVSDSVDLFGKVASELQTGVTVNETDGFEGTLLYVDGYTGFSGDPDLQEGNYLVFHAAVPNVEGVTITATMDNTSTLDEDGIAVFRVRDKNSQTLTVVASKVGFASVTKVYSLSGLTCNEQGNG